MKKTVSGTTTDIFYIGSEIIAEKTGSSWKDYIFFAGQRIAEQTGSTASTAVYLHTDHLGSTRLCTNSSGGSAGTCDYEPYGQIQHGTTCSVPTKFRFAGMEWDSESELYHTWFRQYDTRQGRWMGVDALAGDASDPQTLNRYRYARNDPVNLTDRLGLDEDWELPEGCWVSINWSLPGGWWRLECVNGGDDGGGDFIEPGGSGGGGDDQGGGGGGQDPPDIPATLPTINLSGILGPPQLPPPPPPPGLECDPSFIEAANSAWGRTYDSPSFDGQDLYPPSEGTFAIRGGAQVTFVQIRDANTQRNSQGGLTTTFTGYSSDLFYFHGHPDGPYLPEPSRADLRLSLRIPNYVGSSSGLYLAYRGTHQLLRPGLSWLTPCL